MGLPTDAQQRKTIPLYSGLIRYFPDALQAVAELSRVGNDQHNPGKPLFWDRSKSGDELDALCRHLWEAGTEDTDAVLHSTKIAWRALANLQKELERRNTVPVENNEPAPVRAPQHPAIVQLLNNLSNQQRCGRAGCRNLAVGDPVLIGSSNYSTCPQHRAEIEAAAAAV
jgi:phage tail protein X